MFELFKLAWNVFVLRRSIRDGDMTAGTWGAALLFLLVVMSIGLPTILYYNRHPDADARVMLEAGAALVVVLIIYFWLAISWRVRVNRERANQDKS